MIDFIHELKMKDTSASLLTSFHHFCQSGIVVTVVFDPLVPIADAACILRLAKTESTNMLISFGKSVGSDRTGFKEDTLLFDEGGAVVIGIEILGGGSSLLTFIVDMEQLLKISANTRRLLSYIR